MRSRVRFTLDPALSINYPLMLMQIGRREGGALLLLSPLSLEPQQSSRDARLGAQSINRSSVFRASRPPQVVGPGLDKINIGAELDGLTRRR